MADTRGVLICPLLCFAINCYKKHPSKIVKSVSIDFYDADAITAAKDKLSSDTDGLNLVNWIHPVKRRGDDKTKMDVDDILANITFVDDSSALEKLPRYCIDNLEDIPIMRMERGEFAVLLSKLDKLRDQVGRLQDGHYHLDQARYNDPASRHNSFINPNVSDQMYQSELINAGTSRMSNTCSNVAQSRNEHVTTGNDIDQSTDCGTNNGNTSDGYQRQGNRKKRKITTRNSPTYANRLVAGLRAASGPTPNARGARNAPLKNSANANDDRYRAEGAKKRIIGRASKPSISDQAKPSLQSAKPYIKKLVFGVYNVGLNESVSSLEEFITDICGAQPITCFAVKSRDTESIAFRVCINAKVSERFLDADMWESGIIIRPWQFKPKTTANETTPTEPVSDIRQSVSAEADGMQPGATADHPQTDNSTQQQE